MNKNFIYLLCSNEMVSLDHIGVFNKLCKAKYVLRKLSDKYTYTITEYPLNIKLCLNYDIANLKLFKEKTIENNGKKVFFKILRQQNFDSCLASAVSRQKTIFFVYQISKIESTLLGVYSSNHKACQFLKHFSKDNQYEIIKLNINKVNLPKNFDLEKSDTPMHWHYGTLLRYACHIPENSFSDKNYNPDWVMEYVIVWPDCADQIISSKEISETLKIW